MRLTSSLGASKNRSIHFHANLLISKNSMDILSPATLMAILRSIQLACVTTLVLLLIGVPLSWWLAHSRMAVLKEIVAAVVAVPLVLPPTVLGFYLLVALGPNGPGGALAPLFGLRTFAFSFTGLVIGCVVHSLPFVVQPVRNAFEAMGPVPMEVAATLRLSPFKAFWRVALPLAHPGILTGAILGFAHTVGEYGVVMMIGGNTTKTRVISTTIVQLNENQQFGEAYSLSAIMVLFAFLVILTIMFINKRKALRA